MSDKTAPEPEHAVPQDDPVVVRESLDSKIPGMSASIEITESGRESIRKAFAEMQAPSAPATGAVSDVRLRALLEGLECESIERLLAADAEVLRAVGKYIAKASRLGAPFMLAASPSEGGRES